MGLRHVSKAMGKGGKCDTNNNHPVAPQRRMSVQQETTITLAPKRSLASAPAISSTNPENLPHLPLPKLDDTLQKYLKSVQPFLGPDKYHKTSKLLDDFAKGAGAKLQELLQAKAKTSENWLADWWTSVAYLSFRSPVVIYSNPGLYFPSRFFENDFQWSRYAARVIWASLRYKQMIDYNEIPAEKAGKFPLDMSQYKKIYGTCRIPARNVDKLVYNPQSRYIVVVHKNAVSWCEIQASDSLNAF